MRPMARPLMFTTRTSFIVIGSLTFIAGCGRSAPLRSGGAGGEGDSGAAGRPEPDAVPPATEPCTVGNVTGALSANIGTVGIVTFATSATAPTDAFIDFGLTTSYGMKAPVDLTVPGGRTLLLGMKPAKTYHFKVTVTDASGGCSSADQTIVTGPKPYGLPTITVTTNAPDRLSPGFIVTGQYPGSNSGAYIIDTDGDVVWRATFNSDASSAVMSYDGRYMWISSYNCCDPTGKSNVHRVSMDGATSEDFSAQFPRQHHQLSVLPDESILFYSYNQTAGCDDIMLRNPDGVTTTIVNAGAAQGVNGGCYVNAIQYSKKDDAFVFSDLDHSSYTKVTRTGETVWVLNGPGSRLGTNLWKNNYGLDVLDVDRILIFNNGPPSQASEWQLDLTAMTATKVWAYQPIPAVDIRVLGDVQRLPNGNTMIAFSTAGQWQEVTADGLLVQSMSWTPDARFGFAQKRTSLYGPPPK